MRAAVEADERDAHGAKLRRPDRAAGPPRGAELRGRHRRSRRVERRQGGHAAGSVLWPAAMLTLALALRPRLPAAHPRGRTERRARRRATLTVTECGRRSLGPWRARVGYRGLSARHREGDGTTPIGTFALGPTRLRPRPEPGRAARLSPPALRRLVGRGSALAVVQQLPARRLRQRRRRSAARSEALWRATVAYRELAVVQYNVAPAVPGRGSGIFLHDDTGHATNGCVSLPRPRAAPAAALAPARRLDLDHGVDVQLHHFCIICICLYSSPYAARRHPRLCRLCRPGDARPGARAPRARGGRARLRLARGPGRRRRSTRASTARCRRS